MFAYSNMPASIWIRTKHLTEIPYSRKFSPGEKFCLFRPLLSWANFHPVNFLSRVNDYIELGENLFREIFLQCKGRWVGRNICPAKISVVRYHDSCKSCKGSIVKHPLRKAADSYYAYYGNITCCQPLTGRLCETMIALSVYIRC